MASCGKGGWAALLAAVLVAGCSGGGPFSGSLWPFGGGGAATAPTRADATSAGLPATVDGTVMIPALRLAAAERGRQGVIVRAEGIAPSQGFHSPELRPVDAPGADGIVALEFRALPPAGAEAVGPARTRLLSVGRFYTNREMDGIRGFRIVGGETVLRAPAPAP